VVHSHAAAIDVHSDNHLVCVGPNQVQTFGAYTADLEAIADHLAQHAVTTVVLESTGVWSVCGCSHSHRRRRNAPNVAQSGHGTRGGVDGAGIGGGVYNLGTFTFDAATIIFLNFAPTSGNNVGP
jgi:hypothetical protein